MRALRVAADKRHASQGRMNTRHATAVAHLPVPAEGSEEPLFGDIGGVCSQLKAAPPITGGPAELSDL